MDLDGVLAVLSGMSTLEQVQENIALFQAAWSLTAEDKEVLQQIVSICKKCESCALPIIFIDGKHYV